MPSIGRTSGRCETVPSSALLPRAGGIRFMLHERRAASASPEQTDPSLPPLLHRAASPPKRPVEGGLRPLRPTFQFLQGHGGQFAVGETRTLAPGRALALVRRPTNFPWRWRDPARRLISDSVHAAASNLIAIGRAHHPGADLVALRRRYGRPGRRGHSSRSPCVRVSQAVVGAPSSYLCR